MPHPLAFPYLESTLASPSSGAQLLSFEGRLNALHTLDLNKNESLVPQVHGNAADCKGTVEANAKGLSLLLILTEYALRHTIKQYRYLARVVA
jgi:hypothetical protein